MPGPGLISLGQAALDATELPQVSHQHLVELMAQINETVVVTVLNGPEIIYVDCIESQAILTTSTRVGARLPAYCTCSGQVQLAGLDDDRVRDLMSDQDFEELGPNTLQSVDDLLVRLKKIREDGFCRQRPRVSSRASIHRGPDLSTIPAVSPAR